MHEKTVLGIDIGGTKVCLGIMTESGALLHTVRYPMGNARLDVFAAALFEHVDSLLLKSCAGDVSGIGVGLKGLVDAKRQKLIRSSILQALPDYDLCDELRRRYGVPTAFDNDVHAATLAEARLGAGRRHENFVYVNVGTGTAAGIFAGGRLVRGENNIAGELGNCLLERLGTPRLYDLESVASGKGLNLEVRRLMPEHPESALGKKAAGGEKILSDSIFEACRQGDTLAEAATENALRALALSVVNMELLLNPRLFIFGGGVVADGWFVEHLRLKAESLCREMSIEWSAHFQVSELGADHAGVLGAACLVLEAIECTKSLIKID